MRRERESTVTNTATTSALPQAADIVPQQASVARSDDVAAPTAQTNKKNASRVLGRGAVCFLEQPSNTYGKPDENYRQCPTCEGWLRTTSALWHTDRCCKPLSDPQYNKQLAQNDGDNVNGGVQFVCENRLLCLEPSFVAGSATNRKQARKNRDDHQDFCRFNPNRKAYVCPNGCGRDFATNVLVNHCAARKVLEGSRYGKTCIVTTACRSGKPRCVHPETKQAFASEDAFLQFVSSIEPTPRPLKGWLDKKDALLNKRKENNKNDALVALARGVAGSSSGAVATAQQLTTVVSRNDDDVTERSSSGSSSSPSRSSSSTSTCTSFSDRTLPTSSDVDDDASESSELDDWSGVDPDADDPETAGAGTLLRQEDHQPDSINNNNHNNNYNNIINNTSNNKKRFPEVEDIRPVQSFLFDVLCSAPQQDALHPSKLVGLGVLTAVAQERRVERAMDAQSARAATPSSSPPPPPPPPPPSSSSSALLPPPRPFFATNPELDIERMMWRVGSWSTNKLLQWDRDTHEDLLRWTSTNPQFRRDEERAIRAQLQTPKQNFCELFWRLYFPHEHLDKILFDNHDHPFLNRDDPEELEAILTYTAQDKYPELQAYRPEFRTICFAAIAGTPSLREMLYDYKSILMVFETLAFYVQLEILQRNPRFSENAPFFVEKLRGPDADLLAANDVFYYLEDEEMQQDDDENNTYEEAEADPEYHRPTYRQLLTIAYFEGFADKNFCFHPLWYSPAKAHRSCKVNTGRDVYKGDEPNPPIDDPAYLDEYKENFVEPFMSGAATLLSDAVKCLTSYHNHKNKNNNGADQQHSSVVFPAAMAAAVGCCQDQQQAPSSTINHNNCNDDDDDAGAMPTVRSWSNHHHHHHHQRFDAETMTPLRFFKLKDPTLWRRINQKAIDTRLRPLSSDFAEQYVPRDVAQPLSPTASSSSHRNKNNNINNNIIMNNPHTSFVKRSNLQQVMCGRDEMPMNDKLRGVINKWNAANSATTNNNTSSDMFEEMKRFRARKTARFQYEAATWAIARDLRRLNPMDVQSTLDERRDVEPNDDAPWTKSVLLRRWLIDAFERGSTNVDGCQEEDGVSGSSSSSSSDGDSGEDEADDVADDAARAIKLQQREMIKCCPFRRARKLYNNQSTLRLIVRHFKETYMMDDGTKLMCD